MCAFVLCDSAGQYWVYYVDTVSPRDHVVKSTLNPSHTVLGGIYNYREGSLISLSPSMSPENRVFYARPSDSMFPQYSTMGTYHFLYMQYIDRSVYAHIKKCPETSSRGCNNTQHEIASSWVNNCRCLDHNTKQPHLSCFWERAVQR